MNIPLITTQSAYWLLLIISLSALISYFFYLKNAAAASLSRPKLVFLAMLRFSALVFMGFLLLGPLIKIVKNETQKPLIIVAHDNSLSMVLSSDSVFLRDTFPGELNKALQSLSQNYEVQGLQFGDSIQTLSHAYSDKSTNFESLFKLFKTTYFNRNVGALILASDGIYNKGAQPLYEARHLPFPIYTIPFGDTLSNADVRLTKIEYNPVVYKGSSFPISLGVSALLLANSEIDVEIWHDNKMLASRKIAVNSNRYFKKIPFYIKADSAGVFAYTIKARASSFERNTFNNTKTVYVEVEEHKRKILLLQNGYHPDVALFKQIFDANPAYEIEVQQAADQNVKPDEYALVILHQLPSIKNSLQTIMPQLIKSEIPLLFILGRETSIAALNNLKTGFTLTHKNNLFDEVLPRLNSNFNLFNFTLDGAFLAEMPPLFVPYGDYSLLPTNQILLYQNLGAIETRKPLWAFTEVGQQKIGFIMGEGLWKWRIQEYKKFRDHSVSDELVVKTVQYLALKNRKDPFVLDYSKTISENQETFISARFFNESNELVRGASISLELSNSKGNTYQHTFEEAENEYTLNLGLLEVGTYGFKAKTRSGDKTFMKSGIFIVKENLIEQLNLMADYNLLYKLSLNSGGKQFDKHSLNDLVQTIENNTEIASVNYVNKTLYDLVEIKFLLVIFLFMLCLEWFLRKIWGLV